MTDSGCRHTTRAGHAIDAVLALLWSVRTGQLHDVYPTLVLDAPAFDEDWRWIGSYATWRSAMLVHLYPENLLRPSLRRHQSPALRQAISDLRDARQLSPAGARRVAARYADYFADICQLDLDRLICAKAQLPYIPVMLVHGAGTARDCDVYVAISSASKRVYWTVRDLTAAAAATGYDLGFWHHLDQLGAGEVTELVGLTGYAPKNDPAAGRWLYMFAETQSLDGRSLVFLRLDLTTGNWAAEPTPLEAPQGVSEFRAWLYPAEATQPPRVGLEFTTSIDGVPQLSRVSRALNAKGTSWERADFAAIGGYGAWQPIPRGSVDVSALTPVKAVLNGDFIGIGHDQTVVVPRAAESQAVARLILKYGQPEWRTWEDLLLPSAALAAAGRFVTVAGSDRDAIALVWPAGETWHSVGQAWLYRVHDKLTGWQATQGWEVPSSVVPYTVTAGHFVATELAQLAVVAGLRTTDTGPSVWILVPVQEVLKPAFQSHATIATGYDYRLDYEKSLGMTFRCCPSTKSGIFSLGESVPPGLAVAGDFDGDGRDELAITPAPLADDLSRGNDLWVWDWSPSRGGWAPLGEVSKSPLRTVYDLSTAPFSLLSAVTGDFDGDGRDELALIPDIVDGRIPNTVRILDYQPLRWNTDPAVNGTWGELTALELDRDVSTPVRHGVAGDFDADGAEELLVIGDGWLRIYKYDLRTKTWAAFPMDGLGLEGTASFVAIANYGWNPHPNRKPPRGRRDWGIADQALIQPGVVTPAGTGAGLQRRIEGNSQAAASVLPRRFDPWPTQPRYCPPGYLIPVYDSAIGQVLDDTSPEATRRQRTQTALEANRGAPGTILRYLAEAFYDLPVAIALALQDAHDYGHALDWYRLVYDYTRPPEDRNTYYGLVQDAQGIPDRADADPKDYARRLLEWIRDPLDPHAIAATRPHTYTRATLQLLIRCLLDYADAEFTRDTSESNTRARILYQAARELLDLPVLNQRLDGCTDVIARIPATTEPATIPEQPQPRTVAAVSGSPGPAGLPGITGPPEPASMTRERDIPAGTASNGGSGGGTDGDRSGTTVAEPVTMMPAIAAPALLATAVTHSAVTGRSGLSLLAQLNGAATELSGLIDPGAPLPHAPASPGPVFCVSSNPMLKALRLHAELNLYKIRTCRNISGLRRELEAYAAPTDQESGLPMIGADGQLVLPGNRTTTATPYRYATLIEHARQLAGQARDIEASMLAALQNRDAEALNLLRARQEVRVARASVRLQELRVNQAEPGHPDATATAAGHLRRAALPGPARRRAERLRTRGTWLARRGGAVADRCRNRQPCRRRCGPGSRRCILQSLLGCKVVSTGRVVSCSSGLGYVECFLFLRCECVHHVAMEFDEGRVRTDAAGLGVPQVAGGLRPADRRPAGDRRDRRGADRRAGTGDRRPAGRQR